MRIALGPASPDTIPLDWPLVIASWGGDEPWPADSIAQRREAGAVVGLLDMSGTDPKHCTIVDPQNIIDPAMLTSWVRARNALDPGGASVRCTRDDLPSIVAILAQEYWNLWLVDPNSPARMDVPPAPVLALPANVHLVAMQYATGPDKTAVYDDQWLPSPPLPKSPESVVSRETSPEVLPHREIGHALERGRQVAAYFRSVGALTAAADLDHAIMRATETGRLLQQAGR